MKRAAIVLAVVLGVVSVGVNGVALYQWGGQQTALSQVQERYEVTVLERDELAARLEAAEADLQEAQGSADARIEERDTARSERDQAQDDLARVSTSVDKLEARVDELTEERDTAVADLSAAQDVSADAAPEPAPAPDPANIGLYDGASLERMITEAEKEELRDTGLVACEELSCWYLNW